MKINGETNNTGNKGIITALVAADTAKRISVVPFRYLYGGLAKSVSKISAEESEQLRDAINDVFAKTGMEKQNYKILTLKEQTPVCLGEKLKNIKNTFLNIDKTNKSQGTLKAINSLYRYDEEDKEVLDRLTNSYKRSKQYKRIASKTYLADEIAEIKMKKAIYRIKNGKNAALNVGSKMIILPEKSMQTSAFHEMGHYLNRTHKITNVISKLKFRLRYVPSAVLLLALLNKRDVQNNENKENETVLQKAHDGIKKHAGLIASLSLLPKLADEGMASVRGQKLAKQLVSQGKLSQSLYNKVKATNIIGFCSYLTGMIMTGLITNAAVKLKDGIQKKYENRNTENKPNNFISDLIQVPDIFSDFKKMSK